jgi:hypothetical protein
MGKSLHTLKTLRQIALDHVTSPQPDLAVISRELSRVVHQDADALLRGLAHLQSRAHGFERWLLGQRQGKAPVSLLLMAWPANYSTPVHDHGGLWGLELVLNGALEVDAYERDAIDGELRLQGRTWLGIGDATWFDNTQPHAHRCRNLSRHETALSLHVYGGDLAQYLAYEQAERSKRWLAKPQRSAIAGRLHA